MIETLSEAQVEIERLRAENAALEVRTVALEKLLERRTEQVAELQKCITELQEQMRGLQRKLNQDSTNSSKPPSSDPPWKQTRSGKKTSGRSRGGQKGHKGWFRTRAPSAEVTRTERHDPVWCRHCGACLEEAPYCGSAHRVQSYDLPPTQAEVYEHHAMKKRCTRCGKSTRANLPKEVLRHRWGPGVLARVGYLTGAFRMSRRNVQSYLEHVHGLGMSLGAVSECERDISEALRTPYHQAHLFAQQQSVANADETSWIQRTETLWMWVLSTSKVRVFRIQKHRNTEAAQTLLGDFEGILGSDRLGSYNTHPMQQRQVCWAHLLRDFEAIQQSQSVGSPIGKALCEQTYAMFSLWHRFRERTCTRPELITHMNPIQAHIEHLLEQGATSECSFTQGKCKSILRVKPALWTFVTQHGVEPTNNQAERDLRPAVLFRKTSFGSQSERGSRFIERILTVISSLKAQRRDVLAFLRQALLAHSHGLAPPSLLPLGT